MIKDEDIIYPMDYDAVGNQIYQAAKANDSRAINQILINLYFKAFGEGNRHGYSTGYLNGKDHGWSDDLDADMVKNEKN